MSSVDSVLRTENLVKIYKQRRVVDGVSLEVHKGEVVGLLGPNGAGKTTTFRMIVGMLPPEQGCIYLDGQDISRQPMYRRAQIGISYLPQESSIFRKLTVQNNMLAILEFSNLPREQQLQRTDELLEELGVIHLKHNMAYTLSGGEQRRVEISRALINAPMFMLLDEPFAGIDPLAVIDLQQIIAHLKSKGIGILITDHNVRETLAITDRAYIMYNGKIEIFGTSEELATSEKARKIYLGDRFTLPQNEAASAADSSRKKQMKRSTKE